MKKLFKPYLTKQFTVFVAFALSALCALCFCSAGCKNQTVKISVSENVAEKPFFEIEDLSDAKYKQLEFIDNSENSDSDMFDVFLGYYKNEFKKLYKGSFVLLNPNYGKELSPWEAGQKFNILTESAEQENIVNPIAVEAFRIYDESLGGNTDNNGGVTEGNYRYSLSMLMISLPQNKAVSNKITLEFGQCGNSDKYIYTNYINLYAGADCIGTCYFEEAVQTPLTWFENYFANNLVIG